MVDGCKIIRFADGIAIAGNSEEELQNAFHAMNIILKDKFGMRINMRKTKMMKCTKDGKQVCVT